MSLLQRGLMFVLAAGTLALPSSNPPEVRAGGRAAVTVDPQTVSVYTPGEKEYYLTESQVDFIRPGLKITIGDVTDMAAGKKPSVELTLTDDLNQPLDRLGATTPGVVSARFVPAVFDPATNYYTNLLVAANGNPSRDSTGTWTDLGGGKYKYTFGLALPAFDNTKPMTLLVGASRNMVAYLNKTYYFNTFKDFVPSTGAAATTWGVTGIAKCNACHDPLALHGGNYRDIRACVLCHNNNNMKGSLAEFNMGFWHRIHSSSSEEIGEVTYPQAYLNNCEACHDPKAPQGAFYLTKPSRTACGGCHSTVDFATGEGHGADKLVQTDDTKCAECHQPDSGQEYDDSIVGAHFLPYESKQLKGIKAEIIDVTNTAPGQNPVVTFKLTENDGKVLDPKPFGTGIAILAGGPTTDYAIFPAANENASGAVFNGTLAVHTMAWKVPADFKGTLTFAMDVRRAVKLNAGTPKERSYNESAVNPIKHVASTGTVVARRAVVNQTLCLKCHDRLAMHGGRRLAVAECLLCHAPNGTDAARRPPTNATGESIQMARMIHRIHTGVDLTQDYTVQASAGHNYNGIMYPGDRRNCAACHANNTWNLPAATGTLSVPTPRDYFTPQGPGTVACLGCHDTRDAAAHAYLNTAVFGEACGACHGANSEWSVAKVHAR